MKIPRITMKTGLTISAVGHAIVLAWGLVSISSKTLDAPPIESMPVDIVSSTEFSQLRAGSRTAPKAEKPKPLVEKIAEPKPAQSAAAKVVEKPEIVPAVAQQPPPPEPKVVESKPKPAPPPAAEAKPEPNPKEAAKKEPDPIAEALKLDEAKKPEPKPEPKKVEAKKPEPKKPDPVKPAKPQPEFDPHRISALLDKREPQRQAALGDTISRTPSLGTATGSAPQLSQSEKDALKKRLGDCWSPPAGAANADKLTVPIVIRFKPDGTLAAPPEPETRARDAYTQAMIDSAVRATIRCQPYTMLSPAKYDTWKEILVDFSLDSMFGG